VIRFVAEVQGEVQLDRAFNRVDQEISDFRNFWPGVILAFYEIETAQFATEGAQGASGQWAALSPAYKIFKEIEFPGKTILRRTDALYESMTGPDALDSIVRPEKDELTIGSALPYALVHQKTRPIISLSEDNKRKIVKSIQQRLVEFARSAGFQVEEKAA
jgi:phage gpG-like protein